MIPMVFLNQNEGAPGPTLLGTGMAAGTTYPAANPSTPHPSEFPLTPSFHSQKTSRHFADNYSATAHNRIVIETTSSANLPHANSNPHKYLPLTSIYLNL